MAPDNEFEGKAAIVTGGGAGIGLAVARALAERGASVVVPDYNGEAAARAAQELEALGARALAFQADVADATRMAEVVDATVDAFGGVHIRINNAGNPPAAGGEDNDGGACALGVQTPIHLERPVGIELDDRARLHLVGSEIQER